MKIRHLDQVSAGEVVRMLGFVRCRRCGLRLTEMGLTPGTPIEVLRASRGQPLLLRVRGSQLAVDRETARKIHVVAAEGELSGSTKKMRSRRHIGIGSRRKGRGGGQGRGHARRLHAPLMEPEDE
jgi:Fe2+ transport system protein FeoA